jgi:hypothetical protein
LNLGEFVTENGFITYQLDLVLPGGTGNIVILKNTRALTSNGTRLTAIRVLPIENPPAIPANCLIIGPAYEFGPDGAIFSPPIIITLKYDPTLLSEGISDGKLYMAYFDVQTGKWVKVGGAANATNHTLTAQAAHFTVFAILAETTIVLPSTLDIPGTTATTPDVSWGLTGGIVSGVVLIILTLYIIRRRRGRRAEQWDWNGSDWTLRKRRPNKGWHWNGTTWVPPED